LYKQKLSRGVALSALHAVTRCRPPCPEHTAVRYFTEKAPVIPANHWHFPHTRGYFCG